MKTSKTRLNFHTASQALRFEPTS